MIPVLLFPDFDPTLVQIGPFAIRWYALAYIASLLIGWRLVRFMAGRAPAVATKLQVDDFLTWATLGVVLGGRLGYVLFYQPSKFLADPASIFAVWQGGMSFHGGALGVIVAIIVFCWRQKIPVLGFGDRICAVVPLGLGLGRCANFINGELWGRPAPDWLPWAMIFPKAGPEPRHPSQIYEALLEGLILFAITWFLAQRQSVRERFGLVSGVFLAGYALARSTGEFFREPDPFLGFLWTGATMGQLLCIPMLIAGLGLIAYALRRPAHAMTGAVQDA